MTVIDILDKAEKLLNDESNVRWSLDELISWLNEACVEIVRLKPTANPVMTTVPLVAGAMQSLPVEVLSVSRFETLLNVGGLPVSTATPTALQMLDTMLPNWRGFEPVGAEAIKFIAYEPTERLTFHVCPPSDATGSIVVVYGKAPAPVDIDGTFRLNDQYAPVALDYVLYRALSKDEQPEEGSVADKAYKKFIAQVAA